MDLLTSGAMMILYEARIAVFKIKVLPVRGWVERFLSAGIHTLCKLPPDTTSWSFGRRPSIAISDRSSRSTSPGI
jgi:hypothetical protein